MKQKRVSFKVAKAIKKAGYQQYNCRHWYSEFGVEYEWYGCIEELESVKMDNDIDAPTSLDVWLWLWREKGIVIQQDPRECECIDISFPDNLMGLELRCDNCKSLSNDPEEAIIAAIEYLVDNDLIK